MESRYRTIHCKMWGDEWFLALTQPQPCGAWLWIWLLTGELTDVVPGLIRSGELGMAEALGELDEWRCGCFVERLERDPAAADTIFPPDDDPVVQELHRRVGKADGRYLRCARCLAAEVKEKP